MADKEQQERDAALRETASHRGFRLVRSRRRIPGTGDYGRYGLADARTGKECFGFGPDGLTASAEEIASYLRGSAAATWRESATTTPDPPAPPAPEPPPAKPAALEPQPARASTRPGRVSRPSADPPSAPARAGTVAPPQTPARPRSAPAVKPTPAPDPEPLRDPKAEPKPVIREAVKADAAGIAALLTQIGTGVDEGTVVAHLAAQARTKTPVLVADIGVDPRVRRSGIVACLGWHILPTLHRGVIGRITLLLVAERQRRRGIGRALIDEAASQMGKSGCTAIEAISDIEIRNVHGFFRETEFAQTSYRLVRPIAARTTGGT